MGTRWPLPAAWSLWMQCYQREKISEESSLSDEKSCFSCSRARFTCISSHKLQVPHVWRREIRTTFIPPGSSSEQVLRTHWQLSAGLVVQWFSILNNFKDFSNTKKAIESLNQGGSWLFLWWQKLRPAQQGFRNKLFFFTDFRDLWLSFHVLSLAHDCVSFQGWYSCSSGKPHHLWYSGTVSPLLIRGQDTRKTGFASPFLAAPLLLFAPTCFPFLFLHQSGCCPPCLLELAFISPSLHSLSTFSKLHWWVMTTAMCTSLSSFQLKKTLKALICQGWITTFQQQTSGKTERNRNWFSPYLNTVLCLRVPHPAWNLSPVVDKGLRICCLILCNNN